MGLFSHQENSEDQKRGRFIDHSDIDGVSTVPCVLTGREHSQTIVGTNQLYDMASYDELADCGLCLGPLAETDHSFHGAKDPSIEPAGMVSESKICLICICS